MKLTMERMKIKEAANPRNDKTEASAGGLAGKLVNEVPAVALLSNNVGSNYPLIRANDRRNNWFNKLVKRSTNLWFNAT